jgi:hypothetical protein
MGRLQDGAAIRAAILAFAELRRVEKAPLHRAPDPMQYAKAGPDTCLCRGRLDLGRHLVEKLVALPLLDRRGQCEQQVHLFGGEAERHVREAPGVGSPTMTPRPFRLQGRRASSAQKPPRRRPQPFRRGVDFNER